MLLGIGVGAMGIFTPLCQFTLAYLYFKKGHIWSRVLNANFDDGKGLYERVSVLKHILTKRVLY